MSRMTVARLALAVALMAGGSTGASAWGWWDRCDCDYAEFERPPLYVYDHNRGPTWTGNGWAYLPIGQYRAGPPAYAPAPPRYYAHDRNEPGYRRHRPMK